MTTRYDAVVVGSGPNGLTAAATLAVRGKRVLVVEAHEEIGGAVRSSDHGEPGWIHDTGATIHALAASSPAYRALDLEAAGVEFVNPDVLLSHVLDDGRGAALYCSLDATASGLGMDAKRYRQFIGHTVSRFTPLADDILGPLVSVPSHPISLARFGVRALLPMTVTAAMFRTEEARALVAGSAAHSFTPLHHPLTTSFALMLHATGHTSGWPFAAGGSQTIANALAEIVVANGGEIVTNTTVEHRVDLPEHAALFLDTSPSAAAAILGEPLPRRRARRFRRFRHGPAAFKVDFNLSGPIPWEYEPAKRSGTVHVIGGYREIIDAERSTSRGEMPDKPFVLACQASPFDPSRAPKGHHTCWSYAHVPHDYEGDAKPKIVEQIERFAPGFSALILSSTTTTPQELQAGNRNLVGGDVGGGSYSGLQILRRPRLSPQPYRTGSPGAYLCSASTPPGAGAHGMSGHLAALDALDRELR